MNTNYYPKIDYPSHPAFCMLDVDPRDDNGVVEDMIVEIDQAVCHLNESPFSDQSSLREAFDDVLVSRIDSLTEYLSRTTENDRVRSWIQRAVQNVRQELWEGAVVAVRRRKSASLGLTEEALEVASKLKKDGCAIFRLEEETKRTLRRLCDPAIAELRERAKQEPIDRLVHNYELSGKVGQEIASFFRRKSICEGLSGYVGSNVEFAGFSLEYSYPKQSWWRGLYLDVGLDDTRTSYMHYDHGCRDPKAIITLSEVEKESGPTRFVVGSHAQDRSRFLHFMIKSLDFAWERDPEVLGPGTYYRPHFSRPEYRREILQLPAAFQGSSHFGEDVLDDTPLSHELLSHEIAMTSEVGDCIVFDGNNGIHRGALVERGERIAFQIVFLVEDRPSFAQTMYQKTRGMALRMLGKVE